MDAAASVQNANLWFTIFLPHNMEQPRAMKSNLMRSVAMCFHQKSSSPQIIVQHMYAEHCFKIKQLVYWILEQAKTQYWSSGTSQEVIRYCLWPLANLQLDASKWSFLCVVQKWGGLCTINFNFLCSIKSETLKPQQAWEKTPRANEKATNQKFLSKEGSTTKNIVRH